VLGGKYEITRILGAGAMGVVVEAKHLQLGKLVAIKVVRSAALVVGANRERFEREGRILAALSSEHVARVHDVGRLASGEPFLVMDLLQGETLGARLAATGTLDPALLVGFVLQACEALAEAHAAGIIHRDLKPDNLFLCVHKDGRETVKLLDFGISKAGEGPALTNAAPIGTPAYMAPEQLDAPALVDGRADVWGLGAILYEGLTGAVPFAGRGILEVAGAILGSEPRRVDDLRPGLPAGLGAVVHRCLAKEPVERYASVVALAEALAPYASNVHAAMLDRIVRMASLRPSPDLVAHLSSPPSDPGRVLRRTMPNWTQTVPSASRRRFLRYSLGLAGLGAVGSALAFFTRRRNAAPVLAALPSVLSDASHPTGPPIKVGVLHSLTGTMATSEVSLVNTTLLAIARINAEGGLLGRPVEAVVRDGRSHAKSFAEQARYLLDEQNVPFVFGCWTSACRRAVLPLFEERHRLLFYSVQYEGVEDSPAVIHLGAAPNQQLIPAVRWAFAFLQKRSFYLVGSDYVFPRVAHEILKDQLHLLGARVVGEAFLPLGTADVVGVAERVAKSGASMILNTVNGDSNIALIRALRAAGVRSDTMPMLSFSMDQTTYRELDIGQVEGDYLASSYFESFVSAANQDLIARVHDRFGPRPVTDAMATAYSAVLLWADAVRRAGSVDPQAVRAAVEQASVDTPIGPLLVSHDGHVAKPMAIAQIGHEGEVQVVWTTPKPLDATPYPDTRTRQAWESLVGSLEKTWGGWEALPH
jgi:urea transport system substrate-binding protein